MIMLQCLKLDSLSVSLCFTPLVLILPAFIMLALKYHFLIRMQFSVFQKHSDSMY